MGAGHFSAGIISHRAVPREGLGDQSLYIVNGAIGKEVGLTLGQLISNKEEWSFKLKVRVASYAAASLLAAMAGQCLPVLIGER